MSTASCRLDAIPKLTVIIILFVLLSLGALKKWPAMRKWTSEFLTKKFGNKLVRVAFAPYGEYEGCEKAHNFDNFNKFKFPDAVKSQLPFPDLVVVRPAFLEMSFSEFMEILQSSNNSDVSAYLEYSSIPSLLPELEQDIRDMPFVNGELKRRHLNIWLSNGNTLGKLHFDPFDNFLCQVSCLAQWGVGTGDTNLRVG